MQITLGSMIPFLGTTLGSAMVFFMRKEMNKKIEKMLLGFAAGVMIAASVWSLLIPAIDMAEEPIREADTIEELCDEFVVFDKEQPNGKLLYYKGFENLKKEFIDFEKDKEKVVVYGAIWTDKGLIYVAKMNDKGELELI